MSTFKNFSKFVSSLVGDEKSEAQTFIITLLHAFGHPPGTLPEDSRFEYRVRFPGQRIKYADFVWGSRCLIEMKSRREKLTKHYQQTFDYWLHLVPHRPAFVILCNFDELWIYDFNAQLQEPMERIKIADLEQRQGALAFLTLTGGKPHFRTNTVDVTRAAAQAVAQVFRSLVARGEDEARARRFALQSVVSMFAEDIGLLPRDLFTKLLRECKDGGSTYDNLGALFRQMNDKVPATHGRFKGVDYFNGGLFEETKAIELTAVELERLTFAAEAHKWSAVHPGIFGSLFEGSLDPKRRHIEGAHFTYEADIQKIIRPTIVKPWEEKIERATKAADIIELLKNVRKFRVLDPACGSGNFLFVAYLALRELEQKLLLKLFIQDKRYFKRMGLSSGISPLSFFGIDKNENAVEVAKVTIMLARRLAHRYAAQFWDAHRDELPGSDTESLQLESDLPLDNLNENIICDDALFADWPEADVVVGNPPYQSKNKMQKECKPSTESHRFSGARRRRRRQVRG